VGCELELDIIGAIHFFSVMEDENYTLIWFYNKNGEYVKFIPLG
jgi:hypothetical protein